MVVHRLHALAEKLGFDDDGLRDVYYQALLRYIGCNAETRLLAAIAGDELTLRTHAIHLDNTGPELLSLIARFIREANMGANPLQMAQALVGGLTTLAQSAAEFFSGHCEVAQRLAERLSLADSTVRAISQVYARWDGKGIPPLKGEAVAPGMLVVSLAQDVVAYFRLGGLESAITMAKDRRGRMYAPRHVEVLIKHAGELLAGLEADSAWEAVLALEPAPHHIFTETEFDRACEAVADFADLKTPFTLGYSPGVAALAANAARQSGLPESGVIAIRRAGLLHDIGRVGVSAGIWVKAGALTQREWEKVRLHPYYTERILSQSDELAGLSAIASLHHERLDGSGYHRNANATALSPLARLLAAADVYHALTELRPHCAAHSPEQAADHLKREARVGRLDSEAAHQVLASAGHVVRGRKEIVAGLTEREVEVLRLVARGCSMKQISEALVISKKTVDNHIQHIYERIGVNTRAGAALWAMEQHLL